MFPPTQVDWPKFVVAVVLLLLPLPAFFGRGSQFRELNRSWQGAWMEAVLLPWHWIDLVRSGAGAWLLISATDLTTRLGVVPNRTAVAVTVGVLTVGVAVQSAACRMKEVLFVPFVYVLATMAVLYPPVIGLFALFSAGMTALAVRSLAAFLWCLPVCLLGFGQWLYPNWLILGIGVIVSAFAALLPLMFRREFVFAHRSLPPDQELLRAPR